MVSLTLCLSALSKEHKIIKASMYPYVIKGTTYYPSVPKVGEAKEGLASWYGEYFHGRKTANGEVYDMYGYSAAHKTHPLGTVVLVSNPKNGKSLKLKINDRGPFWNEREIDLSMGAAEYLGTKEQGVAKVTIKVLSVPSIVDSFTPNKEMTPIEVDYNLGYSAISYVTIERTSSEAPFEISGFKNRKEAQAYLTKLRKALPKAKLVKDHVAYKIKFKLSANEDDALTALKDLKRGGLITGYGLCWSYN